MTIERSITPRPSSTASVCRAAWRPVVTREHRRRGGEQRLPDGVVEQQTVRAPRRCPECRPSARTARRRRSFRARPACRAAPTARRTPAPRAASGPALRTPRGTRRRRADVQAAQLRVGHVSMPVDPAVHALARDGRDDVFAGIGAIVADEIQRRIRDAIAPPGRRRGSDRARGGD